MRTASWLAPAPPTVAVEIASRRVTVVELSRSGMPSVQAYASEALPPNIVVPALTGLNVVQPDVVGEALQRALERAGLRSVRRAALVVPDAVARLTLMPYEQLPGSAADTDLWIRSLLRKGLPFPMDDARLSYFRAHGGATNGALAAVVARKDVVAQYEAVTAAAGIQAGIVDLASLNVMNAVIAAGTAPAGDWLLLCLAPEGTALAILRGDQLMFYRHRAAVDEPLSALVHQTAMFHEDRLGGAKFARVWLCGGTLSGAGAEEATREIQDRLGLAVESVDIRPAAELRDRVGASPDVLDALAAPVGVLLRERKAA